MASERKFVIENVRRLLLKEYLMKATERAGFGGLDIQRTPMGTRITLSIERPGIVIGRQGSAIKSLTETLERDFKFDNPQIEVQEVDRPSLNAQIMAEKLAIALERGWHFRRAGHSTVKRIMDAGARGCQVVLSGKLTGQRHRTEKFKEGHIKYCGEPRRLFMREGFAVAKLKPGIIGVKVQIMDPKARLPDDIEVQKAPAPVEEPVVEAVALEEVPAEGEPEPAAVLEAPVPQTEAASAPAKVEGEAAAQVPPPPPAEDEKRPAPKKGKDLKTKKLKMVAKKLEKLGEDVDVNIEIESEKEGEKK